MDSMDQNRIRQANVNYQNQAKKIQYHSSDSKFIETTKSSSNIIEGYELKHIRHIKQDKDIWAWIRVYE